MEVSISVSGERVLLQLPKSCKAGEFKKMLNSNKANDIKTYCETIRQRINEAQTRLTVQNIPVTAQRLKDELTGEKTNRRLFKDIAEEYMVSKADKPSTYFKYKKIVERALENWGNSVLVDEITPQMIIDYKTKYEKVFKQGTLKTEIKKLKSFFIFAFNSGYLKSNPFSSLKFTFKEEDKPFLTYEEIEALRAAKLPERLDSVRNFFLFLCFSGLEYADVVELTKDDVKTNQYGQLYIKKKRIKTGVEYISILYEDAEEMWRLYDGKVPCLSNQKTNLYLKEVAEAAGIKKTITTLTARHTYATYLLSNRQMPVDIVQKMLGHTTPAQSLHYAKMLDEAVFIANKDRSKGFRKIGEPTKEDMKDLEQLEKAIADLKTID